jgi:hypothetical protein
MLSYNTGINTTPPISPFQRQAALRGLSEGLTPWAANGTHRSDVYDAYAPQAAMNLDRSAQKSNDDFVAQARDLQSQMSIRGLEQQAQSQQNSMQLGTMRQQTQLDRAQRLFGGINGLLSGLFQ